MQTRDDYITAVKVALGMKKHLGNSVYMEIDGYGICLTTENGFTNEPSNRIYLDIKMLKALDDYRKHLK